MSDSAEKYFHRLSELLKDLRVTDGNGKAMSLDKGTMRAIEMLLSVRATSKKVMLIGNGGSAAIASHMQNDLCKTVGVRAIVFNEAPLLTALSNDHGYGCVFERSVQLWAKAGDLLVAISSSGQSENILRAVRSAKKRKCRVLTLSGFNPKNLLRLMGDLNFYVPSKEYGYVELVHSVLSHFLTDSASTLCTPKCRNR